MRFREEDFVPGAEIVSDSGATWPVSYADVEPFYGEAEQMLDVSGETGTDPTDPPRSTPFPQSVCALSATSRRIGDAASALDLNPFRLPLAINYRSTSARSACEACTTCDTFACAIGAKNDMATTMIPGLVEHGMKLMPETLVTQLRHQGGKITEVHCVDRAKRTKAVLRAGIVVLSAGALSSPHLLLASGLQKLSPAGKGIGRYLMRHCNAIVYGVFPGQADSVGEFHKQLGIHDYYFGHSDIEEPAGKLGTMQQIQTPPAGLVEAMLSKPFGRVLSKAVKHLTGLLVIAEDQPRQANRVDVSPDQQDVFGMPRMLVETRYTPRDVAARAALVGRAKKVLRKAGALFCYVHKIRTFSHAVGSIRMGDDTEEAPLDRFCGLRGLENLYVVDGSFMPTSAGINPSLTIAANALRVGDHLVHRYAS